MKGPNALNTRKEHRSRIQKLMSQLLADRIRAASRHRERRHPIQDALTQSLLPIARQCRGLICGEHAFCPYSFPSSPKPGPTFACCTSYFPIYGACRPQ